MSKVLIEGNVKSEDVTLTTVCPEVAGGGHGEYFAGGKICIPEDLKNTEVDVCLISVRLKNSLIKAGVSILGDLDGLQYETFAPANYGRICKMELGNFLGDLGRGKLMIRTRDAAHGQAGEPTPRRKLQMLLGGRIDIPEKSRALGIRHLWVDGKIRRKLEKKKIKTLGDLQGRTIGDITTGKGSAEELRDWLDNICKGSCEVNALTYKEAVVWLVRHIDAVLASQKKAYVAVLEARLRDGKNLQTFEVVAGEYRVTKERIRQIVDNIITAIRKINSPKVEYARGVIMAECQASCCPLTIDSLAVLLNVDGAGLVRPVHFYAVLLQLSFPDMPLWIRVRGERNVKGDKFAAIRGVLDGLLREGDGRTPGRACFHACCLEIPDLKFHEFIGVLLRSDQYMIYAGGHGSWELCSRKLDVLAGVRQVLERSVTPLSTEEINKRGRELFGNRWKDRDDRGLGGKLSREGDGIYLLRHGNRWGLDAHIETPPDLWDVLRDQFAEAVQRAGHPLTTTDFLKKDGFEYCEDTDPYELAAILMMDGRFARAGRKFMIGFRLSGDNGIPRKVPILKELIISVLRENGGSLPLPDLAAALQSRRSFARTSLPITMQSLARAGIVKRPRTGVYELSNE